MNSRERVMAALSHKEADRVPVYPILSGVTRHLVGATYEQWSKDADIYADALVKAADEFELDCVVSLVDLSVECDAWGQPIIYPENEAAHPDYSRCVISSIEDYKNIGKVDYRTSSRMMFHIDACRKIVSRIGNEKPIVAFVFGPLGVLSMLRNQQDMYMDLYDDLDAVKHAMRCVTETLKDYVNAIIDTGVDAVMLDTLYASGSIMSKAMWEDAEGPFVKELADICHERGVAVMIHNCGERIYFDAQIKYMNPIAISFLYPPDDCKDYRECKEKYGSQITLIGCVTPSLAITSTDEEWDDACRKQIDIFKKGGGFILGTGCEYPANAPLGKAHRMVELAKTYGRY